MLAAYTQVKVFDTEWAFIAEISTREAYAPIRQLETLVIVLGAGSVLLLILFSRWLSHSITAPLRSLTEAAEQVADGALDHPIAIERTGDDIDRLAEAFRHMQRSVKDKIELIEQQTQELQQQVKLTHKQNLSLQQADKLKDELLANTSHELRTPIHGIKGMAESMLASQQDLTEGQQKQLGLIIKSADGLARLVDDLLDYHQMRYGQLEIHSQPVSSKGVIRLVLDLCQHLVQAKPLTLVDISPAELPPVLADEQRLEQVLYNLVGNAIKYTPQGKVVISAIVENNFLRIKVTDTGIGIAPDHLEHIFEPLVQMSPELSKQGAGLGLSITRQLVHLMGGRAVCRERAERWLYLRLYPAPCHRQSGQSDSGQPPARTSAGAPATADPAGLGERRSSPSPPRVHRSFWWWMTSPSTCTSCAICCSPAATASCPAVTVTMRWPSWPRSRWI